MKRSLTVLLGAIGLVILISGCQHPYNTGTGSSSPNTSSGSAASMGSDSGTPSSPAGSLQACYDKIGEASPGQRMLAEATCRRNAMAQEPMEKNPGDYLPPPK